MALRAMKGDADAAFFVSRYLTGNDGERLGWALDLFRFGALAASRRVVLDAWSLDHDGIVGDAARLSCFYGLITATRHLDRNIAALPETVTLWRGQPAADDTTGLSWTFDDIFEKAQVYFRTEKVVEFLNSTDKSRKVGVVEMTGSHSISMHQPPGGTVRESLQRKVFAQQWEKSAEPMFLDRMGECLASRAFLNAGGPPRWGGVHPSQPALSVLDPPQGQQPRSTKSF
jgi:hypothetical protein